MNSLDITLNPLIPSAQLDFDHTDLTFRATEWDTYRPEHGKPYQLNNRHLNVYPLKELSRAFHIAGIPRSQQQLIKWETDGILPPTPFTIGRKRYYTENQIRTIVDIALECGLRPRTHVKKTNFSQLAHNELSYILQLELADESPQP
ncbi:MAG: helix-turn-helix domain-containing protein [Exiguobacterium sp.]|uniref:Helix-turn-helix domain-containing protein n=1 Tax=Exiguobacterium alkaliphilum TaxID=1428684 RepID=A0ABT2KWF5_9BACL|nr:MULTISPECIES: MerR family transcriptional regulator [Exiguobacterium]MDX5322291.1 helix-turn-helix domain-containing protein [Exiguobacterium sp.]MCT4794759.1 helix-turn-helix domain-containing protein [Exiguobacterium alkaliphilum]MDX5424008.1 helix-turn-helix domain-containing protein [Exiguobacterium sp.]MDX6771538.1 helix-turn-helix domain-containing protein [Exiguobacterium sp.]QUE87252.1 MerR family transcriptional regulator [Exiguobacterium alkaliphilum]